MDTCFSCGLLSSNTYVVWDEHSLEGMIIDCGVEPKLVKNFCEKFNIEIKYIVLTHGHFDHIWRAQEVRNETSASLYVHELDDEMLTDSNKNAYHTFTGDDFTIEKADILLHDGDEIKLGNEIIRVIHTPGHTHGSVCYDTGDALITGDTIFAQGFGRCDLYSGDMSALKNSIKKLTKMAETENRWIFCGHGENSTLRQSTERLKYYF